MALNEGKPLPEGAAIDANGDPTRDPKAYYGPPAGALLPIGGHKGSGLCMAIDLLAGALTRGGTSDPRKVAFGNNLLSIYVAPASLDSEEYLGRCGSRPRRVGEERSARRRRRRGVGSR